MRIGSHEIDLWFAQDQTIHAGPLLREYRRLLSDSEKERLSRFHFDKHRHQFLVARALLRCALSEYENAIAPAEWRFTTNAYGKPFVANPEVLQALQFNLSHTEGWIVLAVTPNREIGVDVERVDRSRDVLELGDRYFSRVESEALHRLPASRQVERFFDLWTLKESYIKARGKGLTIPLHTFSYHFPHDATLDISFAPGHDDRPDGWKIWQFQPAAELKLAVALNDLQASDYAIRCRRVVPLAEIDELKLPIHRKRVSRSHA